MKKFIFLPILFIVGIVNAGDIVSPIKGLPESAYDVTHSTVAISSQTVSSDSSVVGYRAVYIYNLNATTTIFYTLSASTQNVTGIGWPIFPWQVRNTTYPNPEKIEYNGQINYRLGAGSVGSIDVTKKVIRK